MIALDTNVVLRIILMDDESQLANARRLLDGPCFVSIGVLIETGWVLASAYRMKRQHVARALQTLLALPAVNVPETERVAWAIARYRSHSADLADLLHIAASGAADKFMTLDRALPRQAGSDAPVSVAVVEG